jgi:hypothetical protein
MNAFMIAAQEKNDLAVVTLFHWATDKLDLLKEEDKEQHVSVNLIDSILRNRLIILLKRKVISIDKQQNLDQVLSLLEH